MRFYLFSQVNNDNFDILVIVKNVLNFLTCL